MSNQLKMIGLFSGIGGLELGVSHAFKAAGIDVKPVLFCEKEAYPVSVLKRHYPDVPIHSDVNTLVDVPKADVCVFGFPCQDISTANTSNPKGLKGERSGLFFEGWRIAKACGADVVVIENVPAIRKRGLQTIIDTVVGDGYTIEWDIVSASSVGAPHLRKRWFAVIHKGEPTIHRTSKLFRHLAEHPPLRGVCSPKNHGKIYEAKPIAQKSQKSLLWPTVTKDSSTERRKRYAQGGLPLTMAVTENTVWPTPTTKGNYNKASYSGRSGDGIVTAVNRWPTPRASKVSGDSVERFKRAKAEGKVHTPPLETAVWMSDQQHFPTPTNSEHKYRLKGNSQASNCLEAKARRNGGKLSPEWTELLMGFPKGYTSSHGDPNEESFLLGWGDLKPLHEISNWEVDTPRVVHCKSPDRVKRIKALGNAVVPACAYSIVKRFLGGGES